VSRRQWRSLNDLIMKTTARILFWRILAFWPIGATTLTAGDLLYVASQNPTTPIYVYDSSGAQTLFAPQGGALSRQIAFDANGNLYAAYQGNNTVLKFDPLGNSTVFGSSGLNGPYGLAFDTGGNLYVANRSSNSIVKLASDGTGTVFASSGLNQPMSLAFRAGNLYSVDFTGKILKFDGAGQSTLFVQLDSGGFFGGLVFDHHGNLFAANSQFIYEITPGGAASVFFDVGADGSSTHGLAIDSSDNLFVSNLRDSIWKITPNGSRTLFANEQSPSFMAVIPEPSAQALFILGVLAFVRNRRR
jgi:DNA-binding beta-propeller fold protein YncE